jgi:hypothetical protein
MIDEFGGLRCKVFVSVDDGKRDLQVQEKVVCL